MYYSICIGFNNEEEFNNLRKYDFITTNKLIAIAKYHKIRNTIKNEMFLKYGKEIINIHGKPYIKGEGSVSEYGILRPYRDRYPA